MDDWRPMPEGGRYRSEPPFDGEPVIVWSPGMDRPIMAEYIRYMNCRANLVTRWEPPPPGYDEDGWVETGYAFWHPVPQPPQVG